MERWERVGRYAAYGAALTLTPYVLIKVSWIVGSLLGLAPVGEGFDLAGWVLLNAVTVGMAGVGIALALALVRPWGMRIPGWLVGFCAWTGAGFLVSILPFAVLDTALGGSEQGDVGDDPSMPGWEAALIQFSFIGTGLGLALALPGYLWRRRPHAFTRQPGTDRGAPPWAAVGAAAVGLVWLYWALGGTLGLSHPDDRDFDWHLLMGVGALWALAGALALAARPRPTRLPYMLLPALGWLGSGSLFAWSAWKLPFTVFVALTDPPDVTMPESPALAAVLHLAAVVAGIGLARSLAGRFRRRQ